jgi:glyoxylase-like metal-dependent hydrolase (beta-lactamase superfamily II)
MPVHSWLLQVGRYNVLIDTCLGNDKPRPELAEGHMLHTRYRQRLEGLGVTTDDIDFVLCTHLHVDHVGWNTRLENGCWVPTFPNACYVLSKTEYEAAKKQASDPASALQLRHVFEDSIQPVVEAGKARLVDGAHEVVDQITLRPAPGHSPGHFRIELRSQGAIGVFAGDLLHSPIQIPLWEWSTRVCWDKRLAAASRHELLEFCASENALLLPGHFEAPHVGRIKHAAEAFAVDFRW